MWVSVTLPGAPSFSQSGITALPPQLTPTVAGASPIGRLLLVGKCYSSKLSGERITQLQGQHTQSRGPQHRVPDQQCTSLGAWEKFRPSCPGQTCLRDSGVGPRQLCVKEPPPRDSHTPQVLRTKPQQGESPELCAHLTASDRTAGRNFRTISIKKKNPSLATNQLLPS